MRWLPIYPLFLFAMAITTFAQTPAEFAEIWDKEHISHIQPSDVRHKDLLKYLERLKKHGIQMTEVGRSVQNREIFQLEWGNGPLKVFLWSQMHGDEPTATSALVDIFGVLHKERDKKWVKELESAITIRAVPMLNPDGAETYLRRNAQGLDINRDALSLVSPEARLLKRLRDEWSPAIGFNLHNQQERTTAGNTYDQAAISLLVVYGDPAKTENEGQLRNRRLAGGMAVALRQFIPGHIARYDDEWTPTAFGDNFSAWGTPTILIESGALHGKDELFLVKMNFIAMMTALRSLADGSEAALDPAQYSSLPANTSGRIANQIFRRASVVASDGKEPFAVKDIASYTERRRWSFAAPSIVRRIEPDLKSVAGLDEYDASGFNVAGRFVPLKLGSFAELLFYKKGRQIDWAVADVEKQFPPDAVFSLGRWVVGEGVVPKIK